MKKAVTTFLLFFFILSTIGSAGFYFYLKPDIEQKIKQTKEEQTFENLDVSNYKERVNVLLLGVDSLETAKAQTGKRTDTIMILSVDPITKTGFILSIPRDSYVKIHGQDKYTKINHAHSYGGTELALSTIKDFIKIPIHHYVKVDYKALFKVIDDLGGVEFDVPIDMNYTDTHAEPPLNINLKAGFQKLNGEQAMGLLRFRKDYPDRDYGRIRTQQAFIETVLKKFASPSSIPKIPKHIETVYEFVETDMSVQDILSLIKIGISIDFSTLQKATVPGKPIMKNGVSVVETDEEKKQELLSYLLSGKYKNTDQESEKKDVKQNNSQDTQNVTQDVKQSKNSEANSGQEQIEEKKEPDVNDKNITVLNGSGVSGVARRVSDMLKIRDIIVDSSENAHSFDHDTTMIYYKDDLALANQIKEIIKVGTVKQGTKDIRSSEPDIIIVIGKDFS